MDYYMDEAWLKHFRYEKLMVKRIRHRLERSSCGGLMT